MKIDLKSLFGFNSEFDEKSMNALLRAINEAHISEFDYLKFKSSVQNLTNLKMDEQTSIKSTFTTAQTLGITKEYLLKTILHYKNIIEKEKGNFSSALKNTLDSSINNKVKETEDLKVRIADFEKKIVELQTAIEEGKNRIANVDSEIGEIKAKIETTKNNFMKVIAHLENTINDDESKIKSIL